MEKKISAVEWFYNELKNLIKESELTEMKPSEFDERELELINQAKAMEKKQSHLYAEFAIRCDRKDMKILNFEDWIKLETFKSE